MLHPARNLGLAQEHLSATQGRRNRAQPSCSPCRHFSTCHPGAPLPEPFGQCDPPALPAQSASGRLLEPLLGASSLGQRRAQHPRRQSSLRGERGEGRFNRRQISSVDVSSPQKRTNTAIPPQPHSPAVVSCPLRRRISSMALYLSPFSSQNLRVHPAYSQAPTAPGSGQTGGADQFTSGGAALSQPRCACHSSLSALGAGGCPESSLETLLDSVLQHELPLAVRG